MKQADSIPRSMILDGFATIAGLGGFALIAWGPSWLGRDVGGEGWLGAALTRIAGAAICADGCFAAALARCDPRALRTGVGWFALAHAIVLLVLISQRASTLEAGPVDLAIHTMLGVAVVFAFLWFTADGLNAKRLWSPTPLLGGFPPEERSSESTYAEQIRKAAAQEERNRLARDLHDSVKQQLFAIQTAAATAQARYGEDNNGALEALEQVRSSAREAMTEMEVMLDQLRATPLENVGLTESLRKQCEALQHRSGAAVTMELASLPDSITVAPGAQEALSRVAQEALSNVARHARAKNVKVRLGEVRGALQLEVEDDGSGFDPELTGSGMGLRNMRNRMDEAGGQFEVRTWAGGGCAITARVRLHKRTTPREYLQHAAGWTLLTGISFAVMVREPTMSNGAMVLICGLASARQLLAYANARRPMA